MKKSILIFFALLLMPLASLKAAVFIEGTHTGDSLLFGVLIVNCKDSHETCVIINTSGSTYMVNIPDKSGEWFHCDDYAVTQDDNGGTQILFYGVK
jgi:hypothetical protein